MPRTVEIARPAELSELAQATLRRLLRAWFDFERRLARIPLLQRLDAGTFTREDYLGLLLNLRQQIIEGSRWISRCASSFAPYRRSSDAMCGCSQWVMESVGARSVTQPQRRQPPRRTENDRTLSVGRAA